jgi:hypothetical protein
MAFTGFDLPDIGNSNLDSAAERRQILEYLFQLTKQLRYTLNNLGEENLSDELNSTIQEASRSAVSVERIIRNVEGSVSKIQQTANSIKLEVATKVGENEIISKINQTSESILIQANRLNLSGYVTINSLKAGGTTTIDGGRITTGKVAAERIDVDNLWVKHLNGANGTFSGSLSAATGTFSGSLKAASGTFTELTASNGAVKFTGNNINICGVEIGYVSYYSQVCVVPPSHQTGNVGTGSLAWDQCVAKNLYSSGGGVNSYSMRKLKKNILNYPYDPTAVDRLQPVTYIMRNDDTNTIRLGLIADDVREVEPLLVSSFQDESMPGSVLTLDYSRVSVLLINEIKALRKRVSSLEGRFAS